MDYWEARNAPHVGGGTSDRNVIQGAPETVYEVAEHEGQPGIGVSDNLHSEPELSLTIATRHRGDGIRLAVGVAPSFTLCLDHVLLSALDFEPPRRWVLCAHGR